MDVAGALWKDQLQRLGDYIKAQRTFNQQSQRDLARMADLAVYRPAETGFRQELTHATGVDHG